MFKKEPKDVEVAKDPTGPNPGNDTMLVSDDGIHLSTEDLRKLILAESKVALSKVKLELMISKKQAEVLRLELKQREMDDAIKKLADAHRANSSDLVSLMEKIKDTYSIDTSKMSFDDETGLLYEDGEKVLPK